MFIWSSCLHTQKSHNRPTKYLDISYYKSKNKFNPSKCNIYYRDVGGGGWEGGLVWGQCDKKNLLHCAPPKPSYGPWKLATIPLYNLLKSPQKVLVSRAQPPPTCPRYGFARIKSITYGARKNHRSINSHYCNYNYFSLLFFIYRWETRFPNIGEQQTPCNVCLSSALSSPWAIPSTVWQTTTLLFKWNVLTL